MDTDRIEFGSESETNYIYQKGMPISNQGLIFCEHICSNYFYWTLKECFGNTFANILDTVFKLIFSKSHISQWNIWCFQRRRSINKSFPSASCIKFFHFFHLNFHQEKCLNIHNSTTELKKNHHIISNQPNNQIDFRKDFMINMPHAVVRVINIHRLMCIEFMVTYSTKWGK